MKILIFGATGSTGKHIAKYAMDSKDEVYVYVRNANKINSDVKEQIHIIEGDLSNTDAVSNAIKEVRPDSIIIASAHVYKSKYFPLNTAAIPIMVKTLAEINLIKSCRFIFLSGLFPAPREEPLSLFMRVVRYVFVGMVEAWASIEDNTNTVNYLLYEANQPDLQFTIVRMGSVIEKPSKGELIPVNYMPTGSVTFNDMGLFLIKLAHGEYKDETIGKAIKVYYSK